MHPLTRRLPTVLAGLLLGAAWFCSSAAPAAAGGPTSVLMVRPDTGHAAALHTTDPRYEQLVEAVRAYQPPTGTTTEPAGLTECHSCEIRLTWLIHDMQIWRIDRVRLTPDDGLWLQSVSDETGAGELLERAPVWHRAADPAALTEVLGGVGLIALTGQSVTPPGTAQAARVAVTEASESAAVGGVVLVVVAVGASSLGLAAGLLVRRRRRPGDPRPPERPGRVVLSG